MVANYNIGNLGSGSRTTTGIVPLSGTGAFGQATPSGVIDTVNTDWVSFNVNITGSATAQVETTFDGTNWSPVYAIKGADSTTTAQITASGLYFGNSIGIATRINVTAVSGTFAVTGGTTDVTNAPNGTPSNVNVTSGNITSTPANSSTYFATSAASTNAALVKGSAGNVAAFVFSNPTATPAYVKLFNKATAPVPGTDSSVIIVSVPANTTVAQELGDEGMRFAAGIGVSVTGAIADLDTTAAVAGVKVALAYN